MDYLKAFSEAAHPLSIRGAVPSDALAIAPHLRDADRFELEAKGRDVEQALLESVRVSRTTYTVCLHGRPFCLFGLAPFESVSTASVWLLSTPELLNHVKTFMRIAPQVLEEWRKEFPILFNFVHEKNEVHLRWLERMGFEIHEPAPVFGGPEKFCAVVKRYV